MNWEEGKIGPEMDDSDIEEGAKKKEGR